MYFGPGLLVAATGVGAGDLATAAFSGMQLGEAVLWAVVVGALIKYWLNEGLMRYQLATGQTLIRGSLALYGPFFRWLFLGYFLLWSYLVSAALMSANGVVAYAIWPAGLSPSEGKVLFGIFHSLVGLGIVLKGGYSTFERIMQVSIALMFVTVLAAAVALAEDWEAIGKGLLIPSIPQGDGKGVGWTLALMGGVGGTVTVLNYGYWLKEAGRDQPGALAVSRADLGMAYFMTALFGVAMVIIGSRLQLEGSGATLVVKIGEQLQNTWGLAGKWLFLLGAWGAVFSSLLGVWQGVPYLFADIWGERVTSGGRAPSLTQTVSYKIFAWGLALIPMTGLWWGFAQMQQLYALTGALFMPMLAFTLLALNRRDPRIPRVYRFAPWKEAALGGVLLFFTGMLAWKIYGWWG